MNRSRIFRTTKRVKYTNFNLQIKSREKKSRK